MAKICLPSDDNCITQFYSIADDLQNLINYMLEFVLNLSPGMIALMVVTLVGIIVLYIFLIIRANQNQIAKL